MARARMQPPLVVPKVPTLGGRSSEKPVFRDTGYVCKLNPNGDNFLSLRTGPGSTYPEILRMGENTILKILEVQDPWYRAQIQNGTIGWAHRRWICLGSP